MLKHLFAGSALIIVSGVCASASPVMDTQARVILVADGCGPAFHRNPFGACVPNFAPNIAPGYVRLPPPCPRGYHRDPDPLRRLCYPNF